MHSIKIWLLHEIVNPAKQVIFGPDVKYYCREGSECVNFGRESRDFTSDRHFICEDCQDVKKNEQEEKELDDAKLALENQGNMEGPNDPEFDKLMEEAFEKQKQLKP